MPSHSDSRADSRVVRLVRKAARAAANRLRDFGQPPAEGFDLSDVPSAPIALYFADPPSKLYQLLQWLPVFEGHPSLTSIIVVRHVETYDALQGRTSLPVLLVPSYEVLMELYDHADFHAVIYVNNGWTNFQSLAYQQAVHIHVNHGESDKICMVSNQAKAYDKVFVAGEAAIQRHAAALAWFDADQLVPVGRPQLDLDVPSALKPGLFTITYAPTWEGEDDANNYTSLDVYGERIIQAALEQPQVRVVYKPHPRVPISDNPRVRAAHEAVVQAIETAQQREPSAGHCVLMDSDVLSVIAGTDLLIADVSSVTLDHLYLRPDAPIVICDRRNDMDQLLIDAPISRAAHVVNSTTVGQLSADVARLREHDTKKEERARLRTFYFGELMRGESTQRFWTELERAMNDHDQAVRNLQRIRVRPSSEELS